MLNTYSHRLGLLRMEIPLSLFVAAASVVVVVVVVVVVAAASSELKQRDW